MGVLSRPRLIAQERFDLEDLNTLLSGLRTDSKFWTKQFLSGENYILKGFTVSGIGLKAATIEMDNATLIMGNGSSDFSWFTAEETPTDITLSDADLEDNIRNYVEIELSTVNGTPITKAFWDPSANGGAGAEFNQQVDTVTELQCSAVVLTGGFSGNPDRIPVAIIDTDATGTIKVILDKRPLFFRLGTPSNPSNSFTWASQVEPGYSITLTGVVGTYTDGETVTFSSGATATVRTGGTTSIVLELPSNDSFATGDTLTGGSSGATGTVNTISEAFTGGDKDIDDFKELSQALQSEIKALKGTDFWYENALTSVSGLNNLLNSAIVPISNGARVSWNGSSMKILDDSSVPANADVVARVRVWSKGVDFDLTRQDDGLEVQEITFSEPPSLGAFTLAHDGDISNSIDWDATALEILNACNATFTSQLVSVTGSFTDGFILTFATVGSKNEVTVNSNTTGVSITPATIKNGMAADGSIAIADQEILYVELPSSGSRVYSDAGSGSTNYKKVALGSFVNNDTNYWIAYREGSKLFFRGIGEIQSGESAQIGDNVPQSLLDILGLSSETSSPVYGSNIRGVQGESFVSRMSVLTDALGDEQEDRSAFFRSDNPVTWTGSELQFTSDLILEIINNKSGGGGRVYTITLGNSPIALASGESVYIEINRFSSETVVPKLSGTDPIPAQSQSAKNIIILGKRVDAGGAGYLHLPLHKQVLEPGQTVRLGASGAGGAGADAAADYKLRLALSTFDKVSINVLEVDKEDYVDGASTGAFSPADKAFKFTNIGDTFVDTQNLSDDFLDDGVDIAKAELYVKWKEGSVDTAATYQLSRDGGNEYQTVTMERVGTTNAYRGVLSFADEAANQNLEGYNVANADSTVALDDSSNQKRAQQFTVTNQETLKELICYLNKIEAVSGNVQGTLTVKVVNDDAGSPSDSAADILAEGETSITDMATGNISVTVDLSTVALAPGTYWIVFETDQAYKDSWVAATDELRIRADSSAPTVTDSETYDGATWSPVASVGLTYQLTGRVHDLRVKITGGTADALLESYGVYYHPIEGLKVGGQKKVDQFYFSGDDNQRSFVLNNIVNPDPDLLVAYDVFRGQTYVAGEGVFRIYGQEVRFEPDFFNDPGENILLIFRQVEATTIDDSQENANKIATLESEMLDVQSKIKNYAQNAEFRFWQRQVPATLTSRQDDQYSADRWYVLTSGGAVNVDGARVQDAPSISPSRYCGQFRQADATARQFGIAQILEADRVWELRGKKVTLNFWAKTDGTEVPNIRAGIVEWTGTADSVTSDLVTSWAATPTLDANLNLANTPQDLVLSGNWAQFSVTVTLSQSFTNLVLFFWTPAAEDQNDDFYVTQVQLVQGETVYPWYGISLSFEKDLQECRRFYEKSYDLEAAPGTTTEDGALSWTTSGTTLRISEPYKEEKRVVGTVTAYNPVTGTVGQFRTGSGNQAASIALCSANKFVLDGSASGDQLIGRVHWTADAEL